MKPMYEIFYRALGGKVQSKDGLSNLVQRQTGGTTGRRVREFNPQLFTKGDPSQYPTMPMVPNQPPFPMPDRIDRDMMLPEPPLPPIPPELPKPTYDPVREAEAERRARELQARKIAELDEAPQTRAEREALQASGGFYRDEDGAVRDAMGNVQEDFGFDYVAPPEPGRPDPVNTPDTPAPEPEPEPFKLDTTPLPPGLVRNPETGEVTIDKELAKGYVGTGGWQFDMDVQDQKSDEEAWHDWDEQDYLRGAYMEGYGTTGLGRGDLGGGWSIERTDPGLASGNPANSPGGYNYALKGPDTFRTMGTSIPQTGGPFPAPQPSFIGTSAGPMIENPLAPMMGQQLQPTGLQGLQQGMGQGFNSQLYGRPALQQPNYMQTPNVYPRPSMQSQNMQGLGQNMQGFGMQSPRPFGQKVY